MRTRSCGRRMPKICRILLVRSLSKSRNKLLQIWRIWMMCRLKMKGSYKLLSMRTLPLRTKWMLSKKKHTECLRKKTQKSTDWKLKRAISLKNCHPSFCRPITFRLKSKMSRASSKQAVMLISNIFGSAWLSIWLTSQKATRRKPWH